MSETFDLDRLAELTARLSPREQLKLVARIGERLSAAFPAIGKAVPDLPGSPAAVLKVALEPPHLRKEDVDELERAIAQGVLPVREAGAFEVH